MNNKFTAAYMQIIYESNIDQSQAAILDDLKKARPDLKLAAGLLITLAIYGCRRQKR